MAQIDKPFNIFERNSFLLEHVGCPSIFASELLTVLREHCVTLCLILCKRCLIKRLETKFGVVFVVFGCGLYTDDCLKVHKARGKYIVVPA